MAARRRRIKVGDRISFRRGQDITYGVVVEDRGDVGVGGRQILAIEIDTFGVVDRIEWPAAELTVVKPARKPARKRRPART